MLEEQKGLELNDSVGALAFLSQQCDLGKAT